MSTMPRVEKVMTPLPRVVEESMPLNQALRLIREHRIRHLPVERAGKVVGIVSDSDLKVGAALENAGQLRVADVMTPDPYRVQPDALLDEVVVIMSEQKFRSVVVEEDGGKVVGIFTENDALRVLGEVLRLHYPKPH